MSKTELHSYYRWFMYILPERINELTAAVQRTPGFQVWKPDKCPASLDTLGEWLAGQVETRRRTAEELAEIKSRLKFPIDVPGEELTNKTFSMAIDTGMYLSQVFLANYRSLRWDQPFDERKSIHYGQPVLIEFTFGPFNPVHMMVTHAYGLARKSRKGLELREIYNIWTKKIRV